MSIESYIQAMPKVDIGVSLQGAVRKETWLLIAEQNEIAASVKNFSKSLKRLENPDYTQLDPLLEMLGSWIKYPEDLTRLVYDMGVTFSKQNIKYAEVLVNVANCVPAGWTFDKFITALSDGKDRVERGWGVRLNWILAVPRAEPRRADDTLRWVISANGRKNGVVAFGVIGPDDAQPAGQFERTFSTAHKKEAKTVLQTGISKGTAGVSEALDILHPDRLLDAWGVIEDEASLTKVVDNKTPISINLARAVYSGWIKDYGDYPLRQLMSSVEDISLNADLAQIYHVDLNQMYLKAVQDCGLTIDELEMLALNAIRNSFLSDEEKRTMLQEFKQTYAELRQHHLQSSME
ncbi:MAG: hypothetical protein D6711_11965 [Chloroflexi bacterium]|nr:MAG: hypothetical protein D6711_11965 [Chloroflexota bacterium]